MQYRWYDYNTGNYLKIIRTEQVNDKYVQGYDGEQWYLIKRSELKIDKDSSLDG